MQTGTITRVLGIIAIAAAAIACFSYVGLGFTHGIHGVILIDGIARKFLLAGWFRRPEYLIVLSMVATIIPIIKAGRRGTCFRPGTECIAVSSPISECTQ
jgi:hypothetical protein